MTNKLDVLEFENIISDYKEMLRNNSMFEIDDDVLLWTFARVAKDFPNYFAWVESPISVDGLLPHSCCYS